MTLQQLSHSYREDAARFRTRIRELELAEQSAPTRDLAEHLHRRILELRVMYRQSRELAELTEHYYERGYYRDEKYIL